MSLINIGKKSVKSDSNYRYTMPRLVAKVESSGNGVKTILVNLADVAKALRCDVKYTLQFFGLTLGTTPLIDKQQRATIKGKRDAVVLQNVLDKFIEAFILCPKCDMPETTMYVAHEDVRVDCAACGYHGPLRTSHKLKNFIIKNPPAAKKSTSMDERRRRQDADEAALEELAALPDVDDDDWAEDDSKEAQARRLEAEFLELKVMQLDEAVDAMMSPQDAKPAPPAETLRRYVQQQERSAVEVVAELKRLELSRGLDEPQRMTVLLQAVLEPTKPAAFVKQIKAQANVLKLVVKDQVTARAFLVALEQYAGEDHPRVLKYLPHMLQALYELEVLDEAAIVSWYESSADTSCAIKARKEVKPVVDWLQNAEEEEEQGDGDEEAVN